MRKFKYPTILIILVIAFTLAGISFQVSARSLAAIAPGLGTAGSFAVLGGSAVTNTGPSVLNGDLGVSPGTAISGFPPGTHTGALHSADAVALQAQNDATAAYNALASQPCDRDLTGQDLGGLTLTPGVYCFSSSAQLTGALILNAVGNSSAVWVFKIGSTLTTASNSSVGFINGGSGPVCNLFWQVGSSATLGTTTAFKGNILASASITLNTNANLVGRALALHAAVTLDSNNISGAGCSSAVQATTTGTTTAVSPNATVTQTPQGTPLPAVTSLPGAGGAPIRNEVSPWNLVFVVGFGLLALFLFVRAYRLIYRSKQ
jgi:hypothetical protein